MGIHDRDYARAGRTGARRPARSLRLPVLSLTLWLILVNVGVFIADALITSGLQKQVHVSVGRLVLFDPHLDSGQTLHVDPAIVTRQDVLRYLQSLQMTPDDLDRAVAGMGAADLFHRVVIVDSPSGRPVIDPRTLAPVTVAFERIEEMPPLLGIGHFSTGKGFLELEVWRLVTFQFLHADLTHLLLNMIGLWFFGPIVEEHFGNRRSFGAFYLTCGVMGAILYLLLNLAGGVFGLQLPGLLFNDIYMPLIGASAGVFGVLMAAAYVAHRDDMLLLFFIPMPIRVGAYLLFALELAYLFLGAHNAGGHAAHIGGAVAGYYLIRRPGALKGFFDDFRLGGRAKKSRAKGPGAKPPRPAPSAPPDAVDAVLDKINRLGMDSLTEEEQRILHESTVRQRAEEG